MPTYNVCMLVRCIFKSLFLLPCNDLKRKFEEKVVIISVTYNKTIICKCKCCKCLFLTDLYFFLVWGEGAGEASIKGIESSSNKTFFPFILYPFIATGYGTPLHPCGNFSYRRSC